MSKELVTSLLPGTIVGMPVTEKIEKSAGGRVDNRGIRHFPLNRGGRNERL